MGVTQEAKAEMATEHPGLKANGSLCASVMPSMPIVCRLMSISSQERLPPAQPPIFPRFVWNRGIEGRPRSLHHPFELPRLVNPAGEIKDAQIPLSCVG